MNLKPTQMTTTITGSAAQMRELERFDMSRLPRTRDANTFTAPVEIVATEPWHVPLSALRLVPGLIPRVLTGTHLDHIRILADGMKIIDTSYTGGPLVGFSGATRDEQPVVYVTEGSKRLEAAMLAASEGAQIERIPVMILPSNVRPEQILVHMVKSNANSPFTDYEIAIICRRLVRLYWSEEWIAANLGISVEQVQNGLLLLEADQHLRDQVGAGQLSMRAAVGMIKG